MTTAGTVPARARLLPGQAVVNRLVRGLLRTPLVCRLLGRRLLTVYVVGRRSGRRYPVPVAYCHHEGRLLVATQFRWIRNLRSDELVRIGLMGRRRAADVEVLIEEAEVVELLAVMARDNHGFARFNGIGLDEEGQPRREDLQRAWRAGARVAALSPH
jgi:hypothetical protein